jgi:hypothetical protein
MELKDTKNLLFPQESDKSLSAAQRFSAELRRKVQEMKNERTDAYFISEDSKPVEKIQEIADFIRIHVEYAGREQAVKDIQTALSCLCKGKFKSVIEEKEPLEEDGDFGEKTFAALAFACEHYSLETIFRYLQDGAFTNAVFDTKSDKAVDTEQLAEEICDHLEWEG